VIGLDGVPERLIRRFTEDGTLPVMKRLIGEGTLTSMASSIPEISSIAWSTILTGKNPGEHGILGFMELAEGTYSLTFPDFRDLKAPTFWEAAPDKRCAVLNVPSTYPAREINGLLVSGFVALDLEDATWPRSLVPELAARNYRLDVNAQLAHRDRGAFLADLDAVLDARIETYRWLWDREPWDLFMAVFTGTDRLMHFLFEAFEDPAHEHFDAFKAHFRKIDEFLGWLLDRMEGEDNLLMLSDHGFERIENEVYVNNALREWGFLHLKKDPPEGPEDIGPGTRAFALDPARIFVNREGRYPHGAVKTGEEAGLLDELEDAFRGFTIGGRPVVKTIHRRESIYEGPETERAAELVLLAETGFDLKATLRETALFGRRAFTGKHTQHDAFLYVRNGAGRSAPVPANPTVQDVVPIIREFMGV
jgi:predicted AlkP superfamily phosphohydrolase/phosphomutase